MPKVKFSIVTKSTLKRDFISTSNGHVRICIKHVKNMTVLGFMCKNVSIEIKKYLLVLFN